MHISGTFLNSKIARRIAFVIFLASFIPTVLVTTLANRSIQTITSKNAHNKLVDSSKSYALTVFSNLINARDNLRSLNLNLASEHRHLGENQTFQSIKIFKLNGSVVSESGTAHYATADLQALISSYLHQKNNKLPSLLVIPSLEKAKEPTILLLQQRVLNNTESRLLVAELNAKYVWGNKEDYPSDIRVCARQIDSTITPLFCTQQAQLSERVSKSPETHGSWELFLGGEFDANNWQFETQRTYTKQNTGNHNLFEGYAFITVAIGSLLLVALLSLVQTRRTMVPLERLIEATRNIKKGEFEPIDIQKDNEFGELANAFNGMSSHIQQQFSTLQSLAVIDHEIVSDLNVDNIIHNIMQRLKKICPAEIICVTKIDEKNALEAHGNTITFALQQRETVRSTLSISTLDFFKAQEKGFFYDVETNQTQPFYSEMSTLGAKSYWTIAILWQGEVCAFLSIGSTLPLEQDAAYWTEIIELSNRIGIVISAYEREQKLLSQAQYDHLTGVPNRVLLNDRIDQAIALSKRISQPFWLAFIDIDKFKFINDSFGHHIGDIFLCEIARRLEKTIRSTDTVARFGGDEFIVLLQAGTDTASKNEILQRLMQSIKTVVKIDEIEIMTNCSIGVSRYPNDGLTPQQLLTNADIALYRAKDLGRNNIQEFNPSMSQTASDRLKIETHLRKALELGEFSIVYQPKIGLRTNTIVGLEALIRWNNPILGFISPQQFIPLAEETGLIVSIGNWVLKTACAQVATWHSMGFHDLLLSVNLSARQLSHEGLTAKINEALQECGLEANSLELELTESMMMEDTQDTLFKLQQIKSLGVQLSIDDFGTGYSSLSYLKNLPVDTLKIDKVFIDDIKTQDSEAPIVASIIALAKNLKLKVVAEGVESKVQVDYLRAHGCDEIQGYYYSKPVSAPIFESTLIEMNQSKSH